LGNAKRCQQCLEFKESRILVVGEHIGQNFTSLVVNGMP
jgi:hypothetical protein